MNCQAILFHFLNLLLSQINTPHDPSQINMPSNDCVSHEIDTADIIGRNYLIFLPLNLSTFQHLHAHNLLLFLLQQMNFPYYPFMPTVPHSLRPTQWFYSHLYLLYSWLFPASPLLFISPPLDCFSRACEYAVKFSFLDTLLGCHVVQYDGSLRKVKGYEQAGAQGKLHIWHCESWEGG